jgi:hypothetical protein
MELGDLLERIRRYAMPDGPFECRGTWLRQVGEMRFAPGRRWMPFTAEQWFEGSGIGFRWKAWMRMMRFVPTRVIDSFDRGRGMMTASVLGFVPIARSRGRATDRGEAMRTLAELPWHPFAFRGAVSLAWEITNAEKLRATFDDGRTKAAVEFDVDGEGRVLGASAFSRPRIVGKSRVETGWSGSFGEYGAFDCLRVPSTAEASWNLPEGPFTYWRGRITDFRFLR